MVVALLELQSSPSLFRRRRKGRTHLFLLPPPSSRCCFISAKDPPATSTRAFHGFFSAPPSPYLFPPPQSLIRKGKPLLPVPKRSIPTLETLIPAIRAVERDRDLSFTEEVMLLNGDLIGKDDDAGGGYGEIRCSNCGEEERTINPNADKILTLPTLLTLGRVASIPILLLVFYSTEWWAAAAVTCIFVFAAVTDWLDGFLARKMGSNSAFGAFLDPVADKLMVATTLVLLCTKPLHVTWAGALPWLIPVPSTAIIGREITMSAVREWAASQGGELKDAVAVNNLGKWKTASQLVAITTLLATRSLGSETGIAYLLVGVGVTLLYVSAGLALWSLAVYMKAIWGTLLK